MTSIATDELLSERARRAALQFAQGLPSAVLLDPRVRFCRNKIVSLALLWGVDRLRLEVDLRGAQEMQDQANMLATVRGETYAAVDQVPLELQRAARAAEATIVGNLRTAGSMVMGSEQGLDDAAALLGFDARVARTLVEIERYHSAEIDAAAMEERRLFTIAMLTEMNSRLEI